MTTLAVGVVLDDIDQQVNDIKAVVGKAEAIRADIRSVGRVLTFATKVLALGGAIMTRDPSAVASAAGGLVDALKDVMAS